MITSETIAVVEANYCEIYLETNGCTGGWTMKACQSFKEGDQIRFIDVKFEGRDIPDCFAKAREHINCGVSSGG